jgi:hypothetical protein
MPDPARIRAEEENAQLRRRVRELELELARTQGQLEEARRTNTPFHTPYEDLIGPPPRLIVHRP